MHVYFKKFLQVYCMGTVSGFIVVDNRRTPGIYLSYCYLVNSKEMKD